MLGADAMKALAESSARKALSEGNGPKALEWLALIGGPQCSPGLIREAHYLAAMADLGIRSWAKAEGHLREATAAGPTDGYLQTRLALMRSRRHPSLSDKHWQTLRQKVDPARRLPPDTCSPPLISVWSCGAYFAWGAARAMPWSKLLRLAKSPGEDAERHEAAIRLATGFMCRYVAECTDLLSQVEAVVPIPANPQRYGERMMSLPDELADEIQVELALPVVKGALLYVGDAELRGLSWAERREAIKDAFAPGDLGMTRGRAVLLVDDVMTSGATLRAAARTLLAAGVGSVFGITLSHTEG